MVAYTCNPSSWKAVVEQSRARQQEGQRKSHTSLVISKKRWQKPKSNSYKKLVFFLNKAKQKGIVLVTEHFHRHSHKNEEYELFVINHL